MRNEAQGKLDEPELVCLGSPSQGRCRTRPIRNLSVKEKAAIAELTNFKYGKPIERTQFVTLERYLHCLASPRMRAITSNDVLCVDGLNLVFAVLA